MRAPVLVVVAAGLMLAGCGGRSKTTPPPYPGHLLAPAEVRPDFMLRQRLQARYRDEEAAFDAVLQKHGEELVLLGLAPYGGRAFVMTQRGGRFETRKFIPMKLPFPARHILNDVHRVFFRGSGLVERRADGRHAFEEHGERVVEVWREGRLVTRTFERLDGEPPGRIRIEYEGTVPPDGVASPRIVVRNGWFGYELRIENLEQRTL